MRKRLLIMTDWFYPGFRAGGTISTCYHLAMLLKDECLVYIMTSDRDFGDTGPYDNTIMDQWIDFRENIKVLYNSPSKKNWLNILRQIRDISPDCIYVNSMFSLHFAIYPMLLKKTGLFDIPIVLSPSGMLKESALRMKSLKKKCFLFVLNIIKIQKVIDFQATDEQEKKDIIKIFGRAAVVSLVPYALPMLVNKIDPPIKYEGSLQLVFVGRIHPIKNLHFLIECLLQNIYKIELTIVGPIEDEDYYNQCKMLETRLPANIKLTFMGGVASDGIPYLLGKSHFLVLPTLGENFGYSIVEALCSGRPVIISDKTPWKNLAAHKAGWDLPLNDYDKFAEVLNLAAKMDQKEYNAWSIGALTFSKFSLGLSSCKDQYLRLFRLHPAAGLKGTLPAA